MAADGVAWTVAFAPEEALDGWDGAAPIHRTVPRWEVLPEGAERSWDSAEVKVERKDGWPLAIALRAPSRLTRKQALALADALRAAVETA